MERLKRFISYYKPYKKLFFLDMICAFTAAAVDLVFPVIVSFLLDEAIVGGRASVNLIIKIGIGMLALYFLQYGCNYFVTAWGHIMGARMEYDMRNDIFNHLPKLSFSFYDNNKTGATHVKNSEWFIWHIWACPPWTWRIIYLFYKDSRFFSHIA